MNQASQSFAKFVNQDWIVNGLEPVDLINFWKEFGCDPTSFFRKEGYWSGFASPRHGEVYSAKAEWPKAEAEVFVAALTRVEGYLRKRGFIRTKGPRTACRFCRESVSPVEFYWNGIRWPESYGHYIGEHLLKPTDSFLVQVRELDSRLAPGADAS